MNINAQIIDLRMRKLKDDLKERLIEEAKIRNEDSKLISAAFTVLVLQSALGLEEDSAIDAIVDGGKDFGVDAIVVSDINNGEFVVTLVQSKYSANLEKSSHFPETEISKMIQAVDTLFDPQKSMDVNDRLKSRVEEIRSLISERYIPKVHVVLCNNGQKWNGVAEQLIRNKNYGETVSWQYVGPDEILNFIRPVKKIDDQLSLSGKALVENLGEFRRVMIGKIAVGEIAALFDRHGDGLLERNIRRYLGLKGNRVNEDVAKTLRDSENRQNFYFYNNGLTMICSKFRHSELQSENWQIRLEGLQIVNGGQTSKTIQEVVRDCPESESAHVLVRIYEIPEDDKNFILNITAATNSQNPVDLRDLRSNDDLQTRLELSIQDLGYAYHRQRGGDDRLSQHDITSTSVAEGVLAIWRYRPHQARFNAKDHFGNFYDDIFKKLNGAQAIIAVLILRIAENKRKRPPQGSPDFLPYSSRFIAMMMGRDLLEDMGIKLEGLNHNTFHQAEERIKTKGDIYFQQALEKVARMVEKELSPNGGHNLQKLSALFRRYDLVEKLVGSYQGNIPSL